MANESTSIPVLDFDSINTLREMLEDELDALFVEFLDFAPGEIEKLHTLKGESKFDEISHVAHSLKGSSGNIGIAAMAETCLKLEHDAKNGCAETVAEHLESIQKEFERAKIAIQEMFKANV